MRACCIPAGSDGVCVCVSVAVPAEGQDPGGSPQGDATGEGAVAGGPALPGPALQAAAGHCAPHCYSPPPPHPLTIDYDSFPPSLLLIATVHSLFLALLLLYVAHCPHSCASIVIVCNFFPAAVSWASIGQAWSVSDPFLLARPSLESITSFMWLRTMRVQTTSDSF